MSAAELKKDVGCKSVSVAFLSTQLIAKLCLSPGHSEQNGRLVCINDVMYVCVCSVQGGEGGGGGVGGL